MAEMIERPILFSAPMVRAILDGRKTETRRAWKKQPIASPRNPPFFSDTKVGDLFICPDYFPVDGPAQKVIVECEATGVYHSMGSQQFAERCPYGKPGDRLWVRETFAPWKRISVEYPLEYDVLVTREQRGGLTLNEWVERNGQPLIAYRADGDDEGWIPSIFMPRWASRITLEITEVRVQRLQEITKSGAIAEGIQIRPLHGATVYTSGLYPDSAIMYATAREAYRELWEGINGAASWSANPFVWVIRFRKVEKCEE